MELEHPCKGLVAVAGDVDLSCLANYCAMPSPLRGAKGGFVDDLFVDRYRRGDGTTEALLRCVDEMPQHAAGVWFGGSCVLTITRRGACMTGCPTDPTGLLTR